MLITFYALGFLWFVAMFLLVHYAIDTRRAYKERHDKRASVLSDFIWIEQDVISSQMLDAISTSDRWA